MEQKIKIKYMPDILTQTEKTVPKYNLPKNTNLENFVDLVSVASEEIFSFRVPKNSLYLKVYDINEFIAINVQNENNKFIGYMSEINNIYCEMNKNMESAMATRGEHLTLFKNKKMSHLLNIINPESDSMFDYYSRLQSIIHEIGHATKEEYVVKDATSAKKAVEIAKDVTIINELLEECQELDSDMSFRIIKLDNLDELMFKVANNYAIFETANIISNFYSIEDKKRSIKFGRLKLELDDYLFNRRINYFEKQGHPYTEEYIQSYKKRKVEKQNELKKEQEGYEYHKKSLKIHKLKRDIYESIKELKIKYAMLQPKIKKDNLLVNEGWAQYFSFRVLDHLMEKTDFFDEHKPEICEVSKKYLDLVKEDLSIYGQSYTFFETRENRGATPIELAEKIGIKQGLYSTLY